MLDVKRTTLVPSLRALTAFKLRGELDLLAAEYVAERDAVARHLDRAVEDVTVELSHAVLSATADEVRAAPGKPAIRRRLVKLHALHPETFPVRAYRTLEPGVVGWGRRGDTAWLWFADQATREAMQDTLVAKRITWSTPVEEEWPVDEAIALAGAMAIKQIAAELARVATLIDVDHNGRPYPTGP